jgi:NADH-quinone oxidoreductase subunit G
MAQLRQALVAAHPHLGDIDEVAENAWQPISVKKPGKADFRNAVTDFYLTNPIARASSLMAELSANAKARKSAPMAAE